MATDPERRAFRPEHRKRGRQCLYAYRHEADRFAMAERNTPLITHTFAAIRRVAGGLTAVVAFIRS